MTDRYGFIVMDGNGSLFGTLSGNTREVLHKFTVDLPKKHGRGGQSALRFARLRMEKRHNYVRKVGVGVIPQQTQRHGTCKQCWTAPWFHVQLPHIKDASGIGLSCVWSLTPHWSASTCTLDKPIQVLVLHQVVSPRLLRLAGGGNSSAVLHCGGPTKCGRPGAGWVCRVQERAQRVRHVRPATEGCCAGSRGRVLWCVDTALHHVKAMLAGCRQAKRVCICK